MTIAFLTSEYPGVSHTFIAREIAALRQLGLTIETYSVRRPASGHTGSESDAIEQLRTTYLRPFRFLRLLGSQLGAIITRPWAYFRTLRKAFACSTPGIKGKVKWLAYFAKAIYLARELRRRRTTHLHNHFADASANVAMLTSEFLRIPWSFTLHGIVEAEWDGVGRLSDKIESARFVVAICDFNRAHIMRLSCPRMWEKVRVVRCGLDLSRFPFRDRESTTGRRLRILSVARLSSEKGILGLLEAFFVVRHRGIDAELRLVGDGPMRSEIEETIRELGLESHCTLLGTKVGEEVVDEYAKADVVVLASFMEGLPVVLMEAMASGVPVIAPAIAGIPELIVHERSGLLFSPARWDQLAEHLIRLCKEEPLRHHLATVGREMVEALHDIKQTVLPLKNLLEGQPTLHPETQPDILDIATAVDTAKETTKESNRMPEPV